ncbi:MAG: hypothetical protein WAM39_13275 [Bryobacteraceae bacterium]
MPQPKPVAGSLTRRQLLRELDMAKGETHPLLEEYLTCPAVQQAGRWLGEMLHHRSRRAREHLGGPASSVPPIF